MAKTLQDLLAVLDLEPIERDIFRGTAPQTALPRLFGGAVAAQSLSAATRTVDADRAVHSLHSYFLRAGDPTRPVVYLVDRARDGRSFTTRRVAAHQNGRPIFVLSASFQVGEAGPDHQTAMPPAPDPQTLTDRHAVTTPTDRWAVLLAEEWGAIEVRFVDPARWSGAWDGDEPPALQAWMRVRGPVDGGQQLHACLLTYLSDITTLWTAIVPHGGNPGGRALQVASLDHAMWFHRPFRSDEWLLYDQVSPSASGARGLATGRFYTRDGVLAASVVQEGLVRPVDPARRGD